MKNRLRKVVKSARSLVRGVTKRVKKFFGRGGSNADPMAPPVSNANAPPPAPADAMASPPPPPPPPANNVAPSGPSLVGAAKPKKHRRRGGTRKRSAFKRVRNAVSNVGKRFRNTVSRVFSSKKRKSSRRKRNYRKKTVKGGEKPRSPFMRSGPQSPPSVNATLPPPVPSGTPAPPPVVK
jgi:hypothetical protein